MQFVDRKEELKRLKKAIASDRPELVVIYGRRRLGKSTIIKKAISDCDIYFLADKSESEHQRELLANTIAQRFPGFNKVVYPDWESLLLNLNLQQPDELFTLCLDEFPYLVKQSPDLPSILQKLWDNHSLNYHLILCGSSHNMMYGTFLDAQAPLYGRADVLMRLTPLRLPFISEALGLNPEESIREYAVWGGVPRYWELREKYSSLHEALRDMVFSPTGILFDEPIKLFEDDIKDIVKTATIMSYIGSGINRPSELAARCNRPATDLSRPLGKLIDLGFLFKEIPFGTDIRNSKKSLYKISDPFLSFYYRFVVPNRSFIELGRRAPVDMAMEQGFGQYISLHWEKMCRDAVTGNEINGKVYGNASRWWGSVKNEDNAIQQIELDVVAESLDGKSLLAGECKWTGCEDATRLTDVLLRKASMLPFARGKEIVPVLFLREPPVNDAATVLLPEEIISLT